MSERRRQLSNRAQDDARLVRLIRASFVASHGYGAPRVSRDLRQAGEACSTPRVARLMPSQGLRTGAHPGGQFGRHNGQPPGAGIA